MITTDEILINAFFGFFYCLGDIVDYVWGFALAGAVGMSLIRLLAKKD
jgi:hypothetical protein